MDTQKSEDSQKESSKSLNHLWIWVVLGAVLAAGFWFFYNQSQRPAEFSEDLETREFHAEVLDADEQSLLVEGVYIVEGREDLRTPEFSTRARVKVDEGTEFITVVQRLPSPDEVNEDGTYKPDDFIVGEEPGSFSDLMDSPRITVQIVSDKNIFGKSKFRAERITYRSFLDPEEDTE